MSQKKDQSIWSNIERTAYEALQQFMLDHSMTMSEFVRNVTISKLLDEGYLQQEQLEELVVGR